MVMANPECVDDCACQHIAPQILYELHFHQQVMNIMHLDLKRLDLNLLLVFEAVYRLRSVTRAAAELALSASALSHALIRLRKALADELFYRVGNDMHPTVYADSLAPTVSESLALLAKGLHPRPRFVPAESRESFTFAITDYTAFAVFPALMAQMQRLAPGLSFQLRYSERKVALNDLLAGRIDFALGFTETDGESYPEIDEVSWLEDEYVAICSPAFSAKYGELTLENYLRARHLVVTPWNEQRGVIATNWGCSAISPSARLRCWARRSSSPTANW